MRMKLYQLYIDGDVHKDVQALLQNTPGRKKASIMREAVKRGLKLMIEEIELNEPK